MLAIGVVLEGALRMLEDVGDLVRLAPIHAVGG
jgi:hypothetical protein